MLTEEQRGEIMAVKYTKEWQKKLLDLLEKDEFIENYPSTDGLLRIARLVYGDFSIHCDVVMCPDGHRKNATVKVSLIFPNLQIQAVADTTEHNIKSPFNKHLVATAETKALGRALKKLLGIHVHTHEEMLDDGNEYEKITEQQIRAIENMGKKLKVDLDVFLAENAGINMDVLKEGSNLTKDHGLQLLDKLNQIQNKKT